MNIQIFLKKTRISHGFTQKELAEKTSLSREHICKIEKGASPGPRAIKAILKVFGMERLPENLEN